METKDVIRELRTKSGLSQDELSERYLSLVKQLVAGRKAKRFQISKRLSFFRNCLMCRLIRFSDPRESLCVSVVACH